MLSRKEHYQKLPRLRSASGVLIRKSDRVLIVRTSYREGWEIPGGVVEANESPIEAAKRECLEEIGVEVQISRLLLVAHTVDRSFKGDAVHFIFEAELISDDIKIDGREIIDFCFATREDCRRLLHERVAERVERILALANEEVVYMESLSEN